jgi:hypothetical protein
VCSRAAGYWLFFFFLLRPWMVEHRQKLGQIFVNKHAVVKVAAWPQHLHGRWGSYRFS